MLGLEAGQTMDRTEQSQTTYSIGAVANLTGLPTSTIRTWERRHRAVEPDRSSGGGRRYSDEDVERLQLLVALTHAGESISVVASLPTQVLRGRVAEIRPVAVSASGTRVAVVHRSLGQMITEANPPGMELVGSVSSLDEFGTVTEAADLVFVEYPLMGPDSVGSLEMLYESTQARLVVVEYTFARAGALKSLEDAGAHAVRGPLRVAEVERIASNLHLRGPLRFPVPSLLDQVPEIRIAPERLARLREIAPDNACECPNHVAMLVSSLSEFESYSNNCISENPQERELHARLALGTSQARALMEDLLFVLCEYEGIEV